MGISGLAPLVSEAGSLSTHHNGGGSPHVGLVIVGGVLQLGGQNLNVVVLQPSDALLRSTGHTGHTEEGTYRGTDEIGVVQVAEGVAHDDGIDVGCISGTQDGSYVAGFLDTFHHHDEGMLL